MRTLLFIIDMQVDFCKKEGSLFVDGSEEDTLRLSKLLSASGNEFTHIILTQDNHNVIDISHPAFWKDRNGNNPYPFTIIDSDSINSGRWIPLYEPEKAKVYINQLEQQGEFPHVIWPEHCIMGSYGASIVNEIMEPVKAWSRRGHNFDIIIKGTNPLTEHFGALKANIPIKDSPETQLNQRLADKLNDYDKIIIAGEAKSHCVAATVKQMINIKGLSERLIILEDCMSNVRGFDTIALPVYERAKNEGAEFTLSTNLFHHS